MALITRTIRALELWTVPALLALLNYLDLIGELALNLRHWWIGFGTLLWVGVVLAYRNPPSGEVIRRLQEIGPAVALWALGAITLGILYPEAGNHYRIYATDLGQLELALGPVIVYGAFATFCALVLTWGAEYRHLKQTSPEERILEETQP